MGVASAVMKELHNQTVPPQYTN